MHNNKDMVKLNKIKLCIKILFSLQCSILSISPPFHYFLLVSRLGSINNLSESGLQSSTTDQETIDVLLLEKINGVLFSDGTTVDNSDGIRDVLGDFLGQMSSDESVDFFSLFGGSGLSGTDGPDGFIGNDDSGVIFSRELALQSVELSGDDVQSFIAFSLLKRFTDTEDNVKTVVQSISSLGGNNLIRFVEVLSSFRVTQNSPLQAEVLNVLRSNFTSVSTETSGRGVLDRDLDALLEGREDIRDLEGDGGNNDLNFVLVELDLVEGVFNEVLGLGKGVVGFPVTTDEESSKSGSHFG
jgi:hypothetical protein